MRLEEVTLKPSSELVKMECGKCGKKFMTVPPMDACPFCHARQVEITDDKRPKEGVSE